ncbi:hypothetical protein DIS24_g2989 [Lasiodiplodia hormozganensis]|uniref:G-protein coupled receptors family 2 profile 2 domain-containing protein n=1 Tax=Lasiodiplodia hormozganensis TaxID=869390 RepID=A0AA39Z068_9PEZI|nr:hypothetical protein DIS24_g2989 [Lasiodiplodia hormozganensis]
MANTSSLTCPPPFLNEARFGNGGFVDGRFCAGISDIDPDLRCCLPCPATNWIYSNTFTTSYRVAEGINLIGFTVCLFLMISWAVLPPKDTRRHYLSVGLVLGAMSLGLGFIIPFGAEPEQCYDEITPNDMYTSLECAWSGAFIIAGGLSIVVWIFIRALSMHLQICWDLTPGQKFFYGSQALGWGVIAALFTTTITITGVSFRFGDACHVNSQHSMADFWGPLLGIAGLSAVVQLATFIYCINVYLKSLWSDDETQTQSSAGLPSYTSSLRTRTNSAKAVYRRVKKVVWLQWRGIVIVVFILIDVIFFSVVFVYLDTQEHDALHDPKRVLPWVLCLMHNPNEKEKCFDVAQGMLVDQATVTAVLVMLALAGVQCFILLIRWSMFTGWKTWFQEKFSGNREFVSLDARRFSSDARTFELLKVGGQASGYVSTVHSPGGETYVSTMQAMKSPESTVTTPSAVYGSPLSGQHTPDYFGKEVQRNYRSPSQSFSTPRPPTASGTRVDWDPTSTHARGGLGLHPVQDDSDDDDPKARI